MIIDLKRFPFGSRMAAAPALTLVGLMGLGYGFYSVTSVWRSPPSISSSTSVARQEQRRAEIRIEAWHEGIMRKSLSLAVYPMIMISGLAIVLHNRQFVASVAPYFRFRSAQALAIQTVSGIAAQAQEAPSASPSSVFFASPAENLKGLLTPEEWENPTRLLWTPLRVPEIILPMLFSPITTQPHPQLFGQADQDAFFRFQATHILIGVGVRTPLAILAARLFAWQISRSSISRSSRANAGDTVEDDATVGAAAVPYRSAWKCAVVIVLEEVWSALWRGWLFEAVSFMLR